MKIYLICPVREVTPEQQEEIDIYAESLRQDGHDVHNPRYAVDQDDRTGWGICLQHAAAMRGADRVDVFWDVNSGGSHFDLGMAFILEKDVKLVKAYQDDNAGKSYVKVMRQMKPTDSLVKSILGAIGIERLALTEKQMETLWVLCAGFRK